MLAKIGAIPNSDVTADLHIGLMVGKNVEAALEKKLRGQYDFAPLTDANVVLVVGGDGTLLHAMRQLHQRADNIKFYGVHRGSHGFLMNHVDGEDLAMPMIIDKIKNARSIVFPTLHLRAELTNGEIYENFAINEISLSRGTPQAIKMKLSLDGHDRISNMVGDGVLLATPQGSTAYNFACNGPILPLGSSLLALTPIALFRPRRWSGAVVRKETTIDIELQEYDRRPAVVAVDAISGGMVKKLTMTSNDDLQFCLLVDKNYDLEERIILEQFEV
ncbi:MAG: NAD kinase [Hydrotalea sp.]|nr:NAD kinase [Hydrotalea sp.]